MTKVTVTRLILKADLRKIHSLRIKYMKNLRDNAVVMLMNKACNKVRLIDWEGGTHNYYAPDGWEYDLEMIQNQVACLSLELALSPENKARVNWKTRGRRAA